MIVRNGGAGLARCLHSALPAVDGIVIGDTGSTDESVSVARDFGARLLEVPWENDFAKARNAVLGAVKSDWVLWLDADEMLDPAGAEWIRALLLRNQTAAAPIDAFEVWRWNYVRSLNSRSGGLMAEPNPMRLEESRPYPAYTRYLNTLLFRRLPELYFEGQVHETVARRVRALGLRAAEAPFVIHHFGFVEDSEQTRREKCELYQQLGLRKLRENPCDAWAHYELGLGELEHHRDPAAALVCFDQALKLNPSNENAWIYAGICLTRLGRSAEAVERLRHAEQMGVHSALLSEAMGDAYFRLNDMNAAAQYYAQVGGPGGTVSAQVDCKLGACQVRLGEAAAGLERIQAAVAREPEAAELYEIWAAAAFAAGNGATAARVAGLRLGLGTPPVGSFIIAAVFAAQLGQWEQALEVLREGLRIYPGNAVLEKEAGAAREKILAAGEKEA